MDKPFFSTRKRLVFAIVSVFILIFALAACQDTTDTSTEDGDDVVQTQELGDYGPFGDAPNPSDFEWDVITYEGWKDVYPYHYESYVSNLDNKPASQGGDKHNYLTDYPFLMTLYKGHAFTKGYWQAAGHPWAIKDMEGSPRIGETTLQNCYGCKSPQYISLIIKDPAAAAVPFVDSENFTEPVACWSCHGNDPESNSVGSPWWNDALGSDKGKTPASAEVCGQCHNEYYFDPDTRIVTNPYLGGLKSMTPQDLIEYYDNIGFRDWVYPVTETPMIKLQHPEFEMIYGGATPMRMARENNYACADCHMGPTTASDGTAFTSHFWQSPLKNADLLANDCGQSGCHSDLAKEVAGWQDQVVKRFTATGYDLEEMVNLF
ncbi:MAG: ammonia-forming cytochrome c nitrite reductase subunit c552, partial [Coriobacteriia bacterium]|nr:ammonia-forming cytochrome c nitrite reductase subunit c552 [Coriobacteriia bacterium]